MPGLAPRAGEVASLGPDLRNQLERRVAPRSRTSVQQMLRATPIRPQPSTGGGGCRVRAACPRRWGWEHSTDEETEECLLVGGS